MGEKTHIDQMQSKQPGLRPQMDGRHTRDRITSVSVFLDDKSGHSYSNLQTSTGGDKTLAAKYAYEIMATSFGVIIQGYHADNGFFAEKLFTDAISMANQSIIFCRVGTSPSKWLCRKLYWLLSSVSLKPLGRSYGHLLGNIMNAVTISYQSQKMVLLLLKSCLPLRGS